MNDTRNLVEILDAWLGARDVYFSRDNEGQYPFKDYRAAEEALIAALDAWRCHPLTKKGEA